MSQLEAWIVTALGMGVVFIGLMLCILAINFFNRLARRITWEEGHGASEAPAIAAVAPASSPAEPVAPEVLAVIAAALEIERRLYLANRRQRLTLRRTDA